MHRREAAVLTWRRPNLAKDCVAMLPSWIAGKGNHSVGGRPRIRPAVVRWLTEAGHRFAATPDTGGIVVQVTPGRRWEPMSMISNMRATH